VEEADRTAVDCFRLWNIISLQIIHHLTDFDKSLDINLEHYFTKHGDEVVRSLLLIHDVSKTFTRA
jgi:hypothetical protein